MLLDGGDGFLAGRDRVHAAGQGAERFLQDLARGGVVIHDQHAELRQFFGNQFARTFRLADSEPDGEEERAADARLAFQPDASAHQLDQPPADGEAEARAAVLARGGHVGLGERLEQLRRLLLGHADAGVAHGKLELHLFARAFEQLDVQPDFAVLGELDGVVDEVRQDLAESERVAEQKFRDARRDVGQKLEPFLVRLLRRERGDGADDFVELEVGGFEVELAGLDLGEIEDVVDDGQQRGAGVVDLADVVALLRGELAS